MYGGTKSIAAATLLLLSAAGLHADTDVPSAVARGSGRAYGRLPLAFEPNVGQAQRDVKFLSRAAGYTVFLTATEAVLSLGDSTDPPLRTIFAGANQSARVTAADPLGGRSNYLIGNDPRQWHTDVPQFGKVRYEAIYRGIDLVLYGTERHLEYDFIVAPHADPSAIALSIAGANAVASDVNGDLLITMASRSIQMPHPVAYQEIGGRRSNVAVRYGVRGRMVRFEIGSYDRRQALVIDPLVLAASSYLGGSGWDEPNDLAIDAAGNAYIAGYTSGGFPVTAGGALGRGGYDAFVTKIDRSGSAVVYSTVFGGSSFDNSAAIAVDGAGAVYMAGGTTSADFPTTGATPSALHGPGDAFVVKLDPTGASFVFSTLIGGSNYEDATDIALGPSGDIYIAGTTLSGDLPMVNAAQPSFGGGLFDVFVMRLDPTGSRVVYSTYLGGSDNEYAPSLAVGGDGSAYVVGPTQSPDFPTVNALMPSFHGGFLGDAFVTKLNADGSSLIFSTYLGGAGQESAADVTVDSSGNAYIVGFTDSYDYPLVGGIPRTNYYSYPDAFVTKLDASGTSIVFSARLGGAFSDTAVRVALDADRNVYIAGATSSEDFPVKSALQSTYGGGWDDGFVAKVNAQGSAVIFASYLGGSAHDYISGLAVDGSGAMYVAGVNMSKELEADNSFLWEH